MFEPVTTDGCVVGDGLFFAGEGGVVALLTVVEDDPEALGLDGGVVSGLDLLTGVPAVLGFAGSCAFGRSVRVVGRGSGFCC